jgi:hypothetical protein
MTRPIQSTEKGVNVTFPHDDEKCRQNSVDAECFREASRQFARLATALGLTEPVDMAEVVDHLIARDIHFTYVPGAIRCGQIIALDVPEPHESRTGTVACDRCAGHVGPHRIGDLTWPNVEASRG